ncbi:39S ribosomal protein L49, mitochondrial [Smittium mucronatum]|uniref:Large ribosomal subunit protein mL49 n=1 Tax=Smittium mucronatum TaxID=133383 RepID=A0A1R0H3J2_9FUNG|nr:39S ribosomal protein L49, mitochondrial [Smittium mucronatum]
MSLYTKSLCQIWARSEFLGPSSIRSFSSKYLIPDSKESNTSTKSQLKYFIQRTPFKSLPVYSEFKNNGSQKLTIIRKIEGDLSSLVADLAPLFGRENISIKKINNSVLIKGICTREVRQFLTKKGF